MNGLSIRKSIAIAASGWLNGLIGVILFSGSLPTTRIAVLDLNPVFLTVVRAIIAGFLALVALTIFKEKKPTRNQILPLIVVFIGVIICFPLLSALALRYATSAHSVVFIGLLPLATAIFGVCRRAP